jgi:hypothetical protein
MKAMSIQYTFEKRGAVLYARGWGIEGGIDEDKQISLELVRACRQHGCELLLIDDSDVTYTSTTLSLYELAKFYNDSRFQRQLRAIALIANFKYKEDNDFYETAVRNRGVNLRIFYDFERAGTWLAEKAPR